MSTTPSLVTEGVRITVQTLFVADQSSAASHSFAFAYRIQIKNESDCTVKLLRRFWDIRDGNGQRRVVVGDGVVGQQPILAPGEAHTYTSGSVFATPQGRMEGHYTMQRLETEEEFRVNIPPFMLFAPYLHN